MPNQIENALKRMDELQIAFTAKLGNKVKELSQLILQLDVTVSTQHEHNQQVLKKIQSLSHSLAGSAGTFKHTGVYNSAKAIECLSDDVLRQPYPPANWHRLLLEFIVELKNDIQAKRQPFAIESFSSAASSQQLASAGEESRVSDPIIVVDDDELLVSLIKEQAKHFEYDVIGLLTTEDLEAAIDKYQPAAILIDIVFPDSQHSGIEIINQLKIKHKINCPVIFMSNRADVEMRVGALRAGSDAYIVKPLDVLELIRVLDRLTQKLIPKKSKILIVDDELLTAKFYQTALAEQHFVCEIVLNPMELIDKALGFNPDAILLDVNMPGCDGFELAKIIRQDDSFAHIPLLFLTAANSCEQEIHAVTSGGDAFLDKNAPLSSLIAIIKGHVQRYKELNALLARFKKDELRFRSVTSSSSNAIISIDAKGRIVFWNEGAENIFGYHTLETIGQPLDFIIPPEQRKKYHCALKQLQENKAWQFLKHTLETTAIKKDKSQFDIELTYTEWTIEREVFYTAIIRDITHKKQIEQNLYHKEAYLEAVINCSGEAIITINAEGIMETVNPKAMQIFGYSADELIGQNVSILIPSPEKERHDEYLRHSELHAPRIVDRFRELNGQRKDGSLFALELSVSPMIIAEQRKYVGILRDISERKQFINELLLAKAGAEAASKAKTQFLSSMSHELRTPLNAILGFTQLLQTDTDHFLSTDQFDALQHIHNGGIRLLGLITDVLELAKIDAGVLDLQIEKFELFEFMNEIINQTKPLVDKANLSIHNLSEKQIIFIETDKSKLKQVINHLLSNAIKYNSRQGTITILLTSLENKAWLSISDTGKGIPEKLLPELFKPFSRLGAEVGTIEGTGIGLVLSKKLIEIMKGQIGVTSKENEGTTFWIELDKA